MQIENNLSKSLYLSDHLGSIRVVITESGKVDSWSDYYPFGKEARGSATSNEPKEQFTGKERDIEIGLDYFGARYYNFDVARFMTIDPRIKDFPQWTPYLYAANNPIGYIDKNGEGLWVMAGGGALIGAGVEAITQLISYGEIKDPVDVAIAAGFGAISGGTSSVIKSVTGKFFVNVLSNVAEEGIKSQVGKNTSEYTVSDAVVDAVLGGVAAGAGEVAQKTLQNTDNFKNLAKDADRLSRVAENNGRSAQIEKANKAIDAVNNYGQGTKEMVSGSGRSTLGFIYNSSTTQNQNGKITITTTGSVFTPTDNTKVVKTYDEDKIK